MRTMSEFSEALASSVNAAAGPGNAELRLFSKRSRLLLLLAAGAALTGTSAWLAFGFPPSVMSVVWWLGIVFFGLGTVMMLTRLLIRRPILIVDREGIVDRAQLIAAGRVTWDEIEGLSISTVYGQTFLGIHVHDLAALLARKSLLQRLAIRSNTSFGYAPINLPQSLLPVPVEKLAAWMQDALDARPFAPS